MRFNIRCDMEGLTGVTSYDQVVPGAPYYDEGRDLLMHDLLAVIEGILHAAPQSEIWVYDEHFDGRNVRTLELPSCVRYVSGKPRYTPDNPGFLAGCSGMFLVGFHAKNGTAGGTMPHTYEHDILDMQVNGLSVGEVGMEAFIAGELAIPTLFYSGDSAGAAELQALVPNAVCVAVKESVSDGAAVCLPGEVTRNVLREGASRAVQNAGAVRPLVTKGPVELKIRLKANAYRTALQSLKPEWFTAAEWITITAGTVTEAYCEYWYWKEQVQRLSANG